MAYERRPGKFESSGAIGELFFAIAGEGFSDGEVGNPDWGESALKFDGPFECKKLAESWPVEVSQLGQEECEDLERAAGAILYNASSGSVDVDLFESAKKFEQHWEKLEAEYSVEEEEGEEFEENGQIVVLSPSEVARLPLGSLIFRWVDGRPDGSALVVIHGGKLTQVALLPERVGGEEPDGDPIVQWGSEFVLVAEGRGRLTTHGTAQRTAMNWMRGVQSGHVANIRMNWGAVFANPLERTAGGEYRHVPMTTEFIREHWEKIHGWYLMSRNDPEDPYNRQKRILAKTKSAATAAKMSNHGFRGVGSAWKIYGERLSDFATYGVPAEMSPNAHRQPADEHAARELELYIDNDRRFAPGSPEGIGRAVVINQLRKWKKGTYDPKLGPKAWAYVVESAAKAYDPGWSRIFTPATRDMVAEDMARDFERSAAAGEYDHIDTKVGAR